MIFMIAPPSLQNPNDGGAIRASDDLFPTGFGSMQTPANTSATSIYGVLAKVLYWLNKVLLTLQGLSGQFYLSLMPFSLHARREGK
jgi:hypothetical protein